ncbi:thiamine pyrophosphate-dependent enzyme [Myxococcota bacterium]|nr:thiamine pyrophosphate-dependent enzyme [Myxococcota bacterium]
MHGGARVAEVLKARGVKHLFTLVGGHISPILVESKRRGIRVIDTRDEKNAVFAADAMARLTGVPGVAAVTAGPGVTNAITAVKNAQLAQSPLVLIGGATATLLRGRGSLQDIDQMALIKPHVKYAARPDTMREVVPALEKAFDEAQRGTPGPVFVELAVDLLYPEQVTRDQHKKVLDKPNKTLAEQALGLYVQGHLAYVYTELTAPSIHTPKRPTPIEPDAKLLKEAVKLLEGAERPLLVLGSQSMLHPFRVRDLQLAIEKLDVPVYLSGMARGLFPPGHRLLARHKRRDALRKADVVVLAGVPADFRLDYGTHVARAKVIGINLDREDLTKNRRPEVGLEADPLLTLLELAGATRRTRSVSSWLDELKGRDREREAEIDAMAAQPTEWVNPIALCRAIDAHLTEDAIMVGDGGDFVATAAYTAQPRKPLSWLDPGVFGTLGVGAGFAMAAKLERPASDVWLLYGDGAAGFSIMELDTCVRHQIPVIMVIGNDACWTQIERDQTPLLGDDVACRLTYLDYHEVAKACGAKGLLIERPDQIDAVLKEAIALSRAGHPVLVNAKIGKTDFRKGSISI